MSNQYYPDPSAPYAAISCLEVDDAFKCAWMIQEKYPEFNSFFSAPGRYGFPAVIIGYRE